MAERDDAEALTAEQAPSTQPPASSSPDQRPPEPPAEASHPSISRPVEPAAQSPQVEERPANEAAGSDAAKEAKPKPKPIQSLVDLYTVKGANPAKLLRELAKGTSWKFADDDVAAALSLLPERDPQLLRTRQLLHESIGSHEGRFARTAGDFALSAVATQLDGLSSWPPSDGIEPVAALRELAQRLAGDLRDAKKQRRSHNTLMIGVDILSNRRGLAFEAAAPILRDTLGRPPEYDQSRSNPRRHRIAAVTSPRNDLERVRDLLDLLEPWERELDEARRAEDQTAAEVREARTTAEEATERVAQVEHRIVELRTELERARQEAEASRDQAQDVRIHASADVTELRARSVAFLNTRLRDLLTTAKEASEVDPPRARTTVRLIEQAIQELRKEVEWLRSSV